MENPDTETDWQTWAPDRLLTEILAQYRNAHTYLLEAMERSPGYGVRTGLKGALIVLEGESARIRHLLAVLEAMKDPAALADLED